jgi:hypothetical protein
MPYLRLHLGESVRRLVKIRMPVATREGREVEEVAGSLVSSGAQGKAARRAAEPSAAVDK